MTNPDDTTQYVQPAQGAQPLDPSTPTYGQPTYGQPASTPTAGYPVAPYGVPGYAAQYPPPAAAPYGSPAQMAPTRLPSRANIAGILVVSGGICLALLGTLAPWYQQGSTHVSLSDIVASIEHVDAKAGAHMYLGGAMWLMILMTLTFGLLGTMGLGAAVFRVLTPVAAGFGAVLVYASLNSLRDGKGSVFDHAGPGLWLVLLGFIVAGVGGLLGQRTVPPTA